MTYPEYPGNSGPSSWDRTQGWQPPTQPGPASGSYPELPPYEPAFRPYTGAPSPQDYGAQPFYIEPGQPYAAYTPPKRTSSVAVLLIVMPVVLILVAGVFVAGIISSRHSPTGATAVSVPPASAVTPSASALPSSTAKPRTGLDHFTAPTKVAGLPKSTAPVAKDLVKLMTDSLDERAGSKSVVAVYQDPANQSDIVMLIGTPHLFPDPAGEVSAVFAMIAGNPQMTVGARTDYAAGPLGGTLTCASTTITDGTETAPIGVCMLADGGGLLKTLYVGHSGAEAAKIMQSVRKSFER